MKIWKCVKCKREFSKRQSYSGHKSHCTGNWKSWNKDLTKECHPGIKSQSEKIRGKSSWNKGLTGELSHSFGYVATKETSKKLAMPIAVKRMECLANHLL